MLKTLTKVAAIISVLLLSTVSKAADPIRIPVLNLTCLIFIFANSPLQTVPSQKQILKSKLSRNFDFSAQTSITNDLDKYCIKKAS